MDGQDSGDEDNPEEDQEDQSTLHPPSYYQFSESDGDDDVDEGVKPNSPADKDDQDPDPDPDNLPRIPLPRVEVELDPDANYYRRSPTQSPRKPLSREINLHVNVVSKYLWTNKFVDIPDGFFDGVDDELKRLVIVGRRRIANMEAYKSTRSLSTAKTYDLSIYNARGSPNHYHSSKSTNPECNNTTGFSRAPNRFQTPPPRLSPSSSTSTFSRQSSLYSSQSPD